MKKHIILLLLCWLALLQLNAQYFLTGQDPASIKWKKIQTAHFRFIFPENYDQQARYLANLFEHAYPAILFDLDAPAMRTDVIMHNRSVISNAMVGIAPKRVDMFHTPPQDGYAQDWYKKLTLHELRHVAQLSKTNTGFTRGLRYIFGQQAVAGVFGLYFPFYFVEGDAVATETALSNSGRGRLPLFEAGLRAQLLEIGFYLHDKAYFGSYKDHTPNVYELGYFIVGHNKVKYGPILWENAMKKVARKPWMITPYASGLKEMSGFRKKGLYRETMYDLYEIWKAQYDTLNYNPIRQVSPERKLYSSYRYPQPLSDGSIIATRSSLDDILRIVKIKDGEEQLAFTPGSTFRETLSATDSLVVWSEFQPDLRWSNRNFAVIKTGNLKTGKIKQLTKQSRYFSPDICAENKKIVVAETDINSHNSIVVLHAASGEELFRRGSDSLFFQTPVWMPDRINIITVAVGNRGKSFLKMNTITGESEFLLPFTFDDLALSSVTDAYLLFAGVWSGISNIFAFQLETGAIFQLTSSAFGATDATLNASADAILYADYNAKGYRLVESRLDELLWLPLADVENHAYPLADKLSQMSVYNIDETEVPDSLYPIQNYSKFANLFNFHSWMPFGLEAGNPEIGPGISLLSQNTLSTAVTELGYLFDLNEQTGRTSLAFEYLGWYPAIGLKASTGLRRGGLYEHEGKEYYLKWWETDWQLGMRVPLNLTRNKWIRGIQPGLRYRQIHRKMDKNVGLQFGKELIHSFEYDLFAYIQSRSSKRDLYPRWGQIAHVLYRHSAFDDIPSAQFIASSSTYLPGLFQHHGIRLYGGYQWQVIDQWNFGSGILFPRGYHSLFFTENISIKADYVFPIAYPDFNWPTVFLLKRIRGGIFGDYFVGWGEDVNTGLYSAGIELMSDWHFLNFPFPVHLGARYSHTFLKNKPVIEFLFSASLNQLY